MKFLLTAINTKYIHSNLAIYSLKAYHESKGGIADVEIAEFTINQYVDDYIREIYKRKPDVIAFSCYLWNIEYVYECACELKKVMPDMDIWLGGPEVTYDSISVLKKHPYIKGVMIGEGEETFTQLCNVYFNGYSCKNEYFDINFINDKLRTVNGISINIDGDYITTPPRGLLNMDDIPFVYKDMSSFENKIIYYESSRGCPFGCSYCLSSVEKSVRFRSLFLVFKELKYFLDIKVSQVKFVDRTFNCDHNRTLKLLTFLKENDNGITNFHFEIAADLLKQDEIDIINTMRPGLIQLEIGVQSVNPKTIQAIDRVMNLDILSDVVKKVDSAGNVHQHLDLIAGLPYEDVNSFKHSFNYVYRLRPEQLQLGFLKVLKGSKMHRMADEYGIVYKSMAPYEVLYTNWVSYDDILYLKQIEEMVELYYNSRQYVNTIDEWVRLFDSEFDLYEYLAKYYQDNNLNGIKHSRITRYNILMDCIRQWINDNYNEAEAVEAIKYFEQVLVFDLFLSENLKTRPEFAIVIDNYKSIIRQLYTYIAAPKNSHIDIFTTDIKAVITKQNNINNIVIKTDDFLKNTGFNNKEQECITKDKNIQFVMYDYDRREPLGNNAFVTCIDFV